MTARFGAELMLDGTLPACEAGKHIFLPDLLRYLLLS